MHQPVAERSDQCGVTSWEIVLYLPRKGLGINVLVAAAGREIKSTVKSFSK